VFLLPVLVVAVLAVGGLVVYQHHKPSSATNSAATSPTQTTSQSQNTATTQAAPTVAYLTIKEWGVKLPLSNSIKDAYYSIGGNVGKDGLPNTAWLGLASLNSHGCNATNDDSPSFKPIGSIVRVLPTDTDPVSGKLYTQLDPNGTTINGYYYGYSSWSRKNSSCASATTLQSTDASFNAAAKSAVKTTAN